MINEWLKTGLQCLSFIVSIWIGGFMFHEKVMNDLDKRIEKLPISFSKESGETLRSDFKNMEERMEKRFDKIDLIISDLLKFKTQAQTTLDSKDKKESSYGFNNP